jgi:tetratricopeptide (TPR) repeat protein
MADSSAIPIAQALKIAGSGRIASESDYLAVLEVLEQHECWNSWFKLVEGRLKSSSGAQIEDFLRVIRIQIHYLEDVESAALTCRKLVVSKGLNYVEFRRVVCDKLIDLEDFKTEGALLTGVWEAFSSHDDQVACVERLCFIFEKKSHNEQQLKWFYNRLRKMQPDNAKALRYFRNFYSQSQDWPEVLEVLKVLLSSAKHKQETFRYAQELAAVNLYQLNNPREAIRYIEEFCAGSTLDTSTIHYEAYYRMGNLEGCLKVLRLALSVVEDREVRAIIHYRMGSLYLQSGQANLAYENFQKTLELNDQFLEAVEGLVSSSIKMKNWISVKDWLAVLAQKTRNQHLAGQLRAGIKRLEEGLASANPAR